MSGRSSAARPARGGRLKTVQVVKATPFSLWRPASAGELEETQVEGRPYAGGAVDREKCYDMLSRPLAYYLAAAAGLDRPVLAAYLRYQEAATYSINYAAGMGAPRAHARGLP